MASLVVSARKRACQSSKSHAVAPRSMLSDTRNKAYQGRMRAAISAYKEKSVECGEEKEQLPRNFVKGLLEGYGINRDTFYNELKKITRAENKTRADHSEDVDRTSLEENDNEDGHNEGSVSTFLEDRNNGEASSPNDSAIHETGRKTGGRPQAYALMTVGS